MGLTSPPPRAEMRVPSSPAPALPSGPRPTGRSRGVRSGPGRRGDGKVTGCRRPGPGKATSSATFGLAVGAVLVVLLPQKLGQDELVLLVQLLSLLPAGARRHLGSRAGSPGQLRRQRTRAGAGLEKRTWRRRDRGRTQPQEASAAAAGTRGVAAAAAAAAVVAPTCPASSPGRPLTHRRSPRGMEGEGEEVQGLGRGFRVAPQEETQAPGALRMRRTSREASRFPRTALSPR